MGQAGAGDGAARAIWVGDWRQQFLAINGLLVVDQGVRVVLLDQRAEPDAQLNGARGQLIGAAREVEQAQLVTAFDHGDPWAVGGAKLDESHDGFLTR